MLHGRRERKAFDGMRGLGGQFRKMGVKNESEFFMFFLVLKASFKDVKVSLKGYRKELKFLPFITLVTLHFTFFGRKSFSCSVQCLA